MESQLRTKFLQFIKNASKIEDTSTKFNGIEVTWSSKLNAWKIDMTSSVSEFLDKNPDIKAKVQTKYPNLDLNNLNVRDVAGRKKGIRGVGIEALNQLAQATDNPTDATAFIGSGVRAQGNARGSSKADRYIKFGQEQNKGLPKGAQRWTPIDDGSGVIRNPSRITNTNKQQIMGIEKVNRHIGNTNSPFNQTQNQVELSPLGYPKSKYTKAEYRRLFQQGYDSGKYTQPSDAYSDLGQLYEDGIWWKNEQAKGKVKFKDWEKSKRNKQASNLKRNKLLGMASENAQIDFRLNQELASDYSNLAEDDLMTRIVSEKYKVGTSFIADHSQYPKVPEGGESQVLDPISERFKGIVEPIALRDKLSTHMNAQGQIIVGPPETLNEQDPGSSPGWEIIDDGTSESNIKKIVKKVRNKFNNKVNRNIGNNRRFAVRDRVDHGVTSSDDSIFDIPDTFYPDGDLHLPIFHLGPGAIPIRY